MTDEHVREPLMLSIVIVKMSMDECQDDAEGDDIDVQQVLEHDANDAAGVKAMMLKRNLSMTMFSMYLFFLPFFLMMFSSFWLLMLMLLAMMSLSEISMKKLLSIILWINLLMS